MTYHWVFKTVTNTAGVTGAAEVGDSARAPVLTLFIISFKITWSIEDNDKLKYSTKQNKKSENSMLLCIIVVSPARFSGGDI